MYTHVVRALLSIVLIALLHASGPAAACSFLVCPGVSEIYPTTAVPGNVPAFLWAHGSFGFDAAAVKLER